MPSDKTRVAYYQRQARESEQRARQCEARGDKRGAVQWARVAQGELDAAEFWAGPDSPFVEPQPFHLLDSEFDSAWKPPLTLSTEGAAPKLGDSWRVQMRGVA